MSQIEGIDEAALQRLVHRFYERVRADDGLGPIFEGAVEDWPEHLETLTAFWSSVMLTSGRYKGNPVAVHLRQRPHLSPAMFQRWLALWAEVTEEILPAEAAKAMQAKAARIAQSLQMALDFVPAPAAWTPPEG